LLSPWLGERQKHMLQENRSSSRPRVLLADDHQMLLDALKRVLEPRCEVVGMVSDGRELLTAAAKLQPEIVVLDIAMPQLNGLDAARRLKPVMPKLKFIFMTMNEDPELVGEAFRAGASAFLLKRAAALELIEAIEKVLKGGSYVTPSAAEGQTKISLREPKAREHVAEPTPRQREVIQLLAEGRSMKEVASILQITKRTVAAHKYAVMELLQLKTNADLVQYAIKRRIISI
jgi:DNA-binding NarL/FixJ family response regulator